jgi:TonB family protein
MKRNRLPKNLAKFLNEKTIGVSIVLSLLLHGGVGGVIVYENRDSLKKLLERPKSSEVELVDAEKFMAAVKNARQVQPQDKQGQIVQQDKQLNDEVPVNSRFLSKHNQVVKQQEQAALNGAFKNSDSTGGERREKKVAGKSEESAEQKLARAEQKAEKESKQFLTSDDGVDANLVQKSSKLKAFMPSFRPTAPVVNARDMASGGGEGPSATDDHLKDVKTGMQTVLSTREFLYYSYYNRIRSKLTQYWQPKIKEKMERILKEGRTIASTGDKITKIVIILDEKGILRKVQVLGTAGVRDLDDAAVEAFRAAAPFPNPPKGMVDSDGTIKIRWDFVLEA